MDGIRILGSAAAEAIPAIFCSCRVCREAVKNGGKDLRMRTAYQIGDHVRIDLGPDTIAQELRFQLHSEDLRHLFFTHSHCDHLDPNLFAFRSPGMSHPENTLRVYGNTGVMRTIREALDPDQDYRLELQQLEYFRPVELPEEDMTFHPLIADHLYTEEPVIYAIRRGEKWLLVANDTGLPPEADWEYMHKLNMRFSAVIADCTGLKLDLPRNHMGGRHTVEFMERLRSEGLMAENGNFIINHFSHNGGLTHAEAEEYFGKFGILVGYDGMIVEC